MHRIKNALYPIAEISNQDAFFPLQKCTNSIQNQAFRFSSDNDKNDLILKDEVR